MLPKHVRFIALSSLGAAVAIAINALLLNAKPGDVATQRQAAPKQATSKHEPMVQRRGNFEPTASQNETARAPFVLPKPPAAEGDPAIIRAIKRALVDRGYGPLTADQSTGLITRSAILAFEFDQGLPLAGEATEDFLTRMASISGGSLIGTSQATNVNPRITTPAASAVVRHVQTRLSSLGYLPGPIDGRLNEATQKAIRLLEQDQGLAPRGRISAEVAQRLEALAQRQASAR